MKGFKKYIPVALLVVSLGLGFNTSCTQKQEVNELKKIRIMSHHYKDYLLGTDELDTIIIEKILADETKIIERYERKYDGVYYNKCVEKRLDNTTKAYQYYGILDEKPYGTTIEKMLADGTEIIEYKSSDGKVSDKTVVRKLNDRTKVTECYSFDKLYYKATKKESENGIKTEIDDDADGKIDQIKTEKRLSDGTEIREYKASDGKMYWTEIEKRPDDTTRIIEYKEPDGESTITIERLLDDGTKIKEIDYHADGRIDNVIVGKVIEINTLSDKNQRRNRNETIYKTGR